MTDLKHVLSVGLAAATLLAVLPLFAGGVLLLQPSFAPMIVQTGLVPGTGPAWFAPVVGTGALVLGIAAFAISWNQRSFLVAGLLAASGVIWMIPGLVALASINFAVIVFPGPILGVIFGLAVLGLGAAKGIRTARAVTVTPR